MEKNKKKISLPLDNLAISKERITHMHAVAELLYKYSENFGCSLPKETMYFLGLNHDIGYVQGKPKHEENGAKYFEKDSLLKHCILWHGNTPEEYMEWNSCGPEDIPKELIALWWADLMVDTGENAGKAVGFLGRLEELRERYGENSHAYISCKNTMEWLINNVNLDFLEDER